jgi:hypothetical protein
MFESGCQPPTNDGDQDRYIMMPGPHTTTAVPRFDRVGHLPAAIPLTPSRYRIATRANSAPCRSAIDLRIEHLASFHRASALPLSIKRAQTRIGRGRRTPWSSRRALLISRGFLPRRLSHSAPASGTNVAICRYPQAFKKCGRAWSTHCGPWAALLQQSLQAVVPISRAGSECPRRADRTDADVWCFPS